MKSTRPLFVIASLCLLTASGGYAQQDPKDGKEIPVQQAPQTPSPDEWQFSITPYTWLPTANVDISLPTVNIGNRTIGGDFSVVQPWWKTLSKFSSDFYVLSIGGRVEALKGRWGAFLDGYWIFGKDTVNGSDSRLVFRDRVDITASSTVTDRFGTGQVNFGPQFVLGTAPLGPASNVSFLLYGGGRINWLTNDDNGTITIRASANVGEIGQSFNFSTSKGRAFIEPMIGLKSSLDAGPEGAGDPSRRCRRFWRGHFEQLGLRPRNRRSPGKPGAIPISILAIAPAVNGRIWAPIAKAMSKAGITARSLARLLASSQRPFSGTGNNVIGAIWRGTHPFTRARHFLIWAPLPGKSLTQRRDRTQRSAALLAPDESRLPGNRKVKQLNVQKTKK